MQYKRLYAPTLVIIFMIGITHYSISQWYVGGLLEGFHARQAVHSVELAADMLEHLPAMPSQAKIYEVINDIAQTTGGRVTLITPDGRVMADTNMARDTVMHMENHANRPEVIQALRDGIGLSTRLSSTLGKALEYVAVPIEVGEQKMIFRLAMYTDELNTAVAKQRTLFLVIGFVTVLSIGIIGMLIVRSFIKQLRTERRNLVQARNTAQSASRAKEEFLSSMSHELRTPLNAILGFGQMMQFNPKEPLSPAQNQNLEFILEGGNHLLKIVDDILDLSSLKSDHVPLNLERTSIKETIQDALSLMEGLSEKHDVTVSLTWSCALHLRVCTDQIRFKQILINLLTNAIKYNRPGGTVEIKGETTTADRFRLSVIDTGCGIPLKHQDNIFEQFHRLDQNAHTAKHGIGIGLSVAKFLADHLNGDIGFESEENVGSTFWFELPLEHACQLDTDDMETSNEASNDTQGAGARHVVER